VNTSDVAEDVVRRIAAGEVHAAAEIIAPLARRTPLLSSRGLSEACGGPVVLKAENLQRTGSFKLRGAAHRIAHLVDPTAVVAGSAGNHGQSLAYAARARGIPCEVFMPREAPVAKVAAVQAFGGIVDLGAESVDEAVARAQERATEIGAGFVHPFDDPDVILGQATLGLELLQDVPDLATVIVPVGGGGLISGVAGAIRAARPEVRVVGVQVAACATFPASLARGEPETIVPRMATIADGIAVKRPGVTTLALVRRWVDEIVVVDEDETADAMVWLLERSKLVVEGGGAVGVAALLAGTIVPDPRGATAGCACSRESPTVPVRWRRCSPRSPAAEATSSTPAMCARQRRCTSVRPAWRSPWRPAVPSTASRSSPGWQPPAMTSAVWSHSVRRRPRIG
jgi:threonine dehydratase